MSTSSISISGELNCPGGRVPLLRGIHLSNTTCLTSGNRVSNYLSNKLSNYLLLTTCLTSGNRVSNKLLTTCLTTCFKSGESCSEFS